MLAELNGNLCLSRRVNESIELTLDGEVIARITIMRIQGNRVSLATAANKDIKIMRSELKPKRTEKGLADRVKERKNHAAE